MSYFSEGDLVRRSRERLGISTETSQPSLTDWLKTNSPSTAQFASQGESTWATGKMTAATNQAAINAALGAEDEDATGERKEGILSWALDKLDRAASTGAALVQDTLGFDPTTGEWDISEVGGVATDAVRAVGHLASGDGIKETLNEFDGLAGVKSALVDGEHIGFGDLDALKVEDDDQWYTKAAKLTGAFVADTAADPLTYLTFGAGGVGRRAMAEVAENASRQAARDTGGLADEAVQGLAGRWQNRDLAELAGKELGTPDAGTAGQLEKLAGAGVKSDAEKALQVLGEEVGEAYALRGATGVRRYLEEQGLGHLQKQLPKDLQGGIRARVPFVHDEHGASRAFQLTPGAGRITDALGLRGVADKGNELRMKARATDGALSPGRIADKLGGQAGKRYGEFVRDAVKNPEANSRFTYGMYSRTEKALRASRSTGATLNKAAEASMKQALGLLESAKDKTAAESAMQQAFKNPSVALAADATEEMKAGYLAAQKLHQQMDAVFEEARSLGIDIGEVNEYVNRVMTKDYLKHRRATQALSPATGATDGASPAKSRAAFYDLVEVDGQVQRQWWDLDRINKVMGDKHGFDAVETDPLALAANYLSSMNRMVSEKKLYRELEELGVTVPDVVRNRTSWDAASAAGLAERAVADIDADWVEETSQAAARAARGEADAPAGNLDELTSELDQARARLDGLRAGVTDAAPMSPQVRVLVEQVQEAGTFESVAGAVHPRRLEAERALAAMGRNPDGSLREGADAVQAAAAEVASLEKARDAAAQAARAADGATESQQRLSVAERRRANLMEAVDNDDNLAHALTQWQRLPEEEYNAKVENLMRVLAEGYADKAALLRGHRDTAKAAGRDGDAASLGAQADAVQAMSAALTRGGDAAATTAQNSPLGQWLGDNGWQRVFDGADGKGAQGNFAMKDLNLNVYTVPAVREMLEEQHRILDAGNLQKFWDDVYLPMFALFKTYATVGRGPGYHARNFIGAAWNNHLHGVTARDYADTQKLLGSRKAVEDKLKDTTAGWEDMPEALREQSIDRVWRARAGDKAFDKDLSLGGQEYVRGATGADVVDWLEEHGIWTNNVTLELMTADGVQSRNLFRHTDADDLNRVQQAQNWGVNNAYIRFMGDWAQGQERYVRTAAFLNGLRKYGLDDHGRAGATQVKVSQFDYADLSPFEQNVMRQLIPFYTFTRNNVPMQLRKLAGDPGKVAAAVRGHEALSEFFAMDAEEAEQFEQWTPQWAKDRLVNATKLSPQGSPVGFGLEHPVTDLNRWVLAPGAGLSDYVDLWKTSTIADGNPFIKAAFEGVTDIDPATGATNNGTTPAGNWMNWLDAIPKALGSDGILTKTNASDGEAAARYEWMATLLPDLVPTLGQVERLVPVAQPEKYSNRLATSWASQALGLPVMTLSENQLGGEAATRGNRMSRWADEEMGARNLDPEMVKALIDKLGVERARAAIAAGLADRSG